ncbi:hypothetical protein [Neisseria shayeganii]|uniref:Uncharacterized protein n=1 Tax=Neisseria shayeganii 871 TaxID=1032488 RepID=G4CLJ4_9NEIS|nr:hypothetical protein [Neisseria shayeganii]EGY51313.1 hypothetical protein HMPREF9371_2485 [Neisseria shayeganii 871]
MKILYFLSHDGDNYFITKSYKEAVNWQESQELNFATEICYDEDFRITHIDRNEIDWFAESISDEIGSPQFQEAKEMLNKEYEFPEELK